MSNEKLLEIVEQLQQEVISLKNKVELLEKKTQKEKNSERISKRGII